jgi:hypothetical protein
MTDKPKWNDATSYSRGERGKIEPTAWDIKFGGVRLWVGKGHRWYPGKWVAVCPDAWHEQRELGDADLPAETAQSLALDMAANHMRSRAARMVAAADAMIAARKGEQP